MSKIRSLPARAMRHMLLKASGFPAIEFTRSKKSRVFEAVYQGTNLRMVKHDGQFKVDCNGLRDIGWLN